MGSGQHLVIILALREGCNRPLGPERRMPMLQIRALDVPSRRIGNPLVRMGQQKLPRVRKT
jgi:hypothetical protein